MKQSNYSQVLFALEIETSKIDKNKAQSIFSESFYNPDGGYDSMHNDYENDIRP